MRSFNAYFEACRKFDKAFDRKFDIESWRVHSIELISIISYERKKWKEVKILNLLNFLASTFDWERRLLITKITVLFSSHVESIVWSIVWLMLCIHNLKHVKRLIECLIENLIGNLVENLIGNLSERVNKRVGERVDERLSTYATYVMKAKFSSAHMNKRRFYRQKRDTVQRYMNKHRFCRQKQIAA